MCPPPLCILVLRPWGRKTAPKASLKVAAAIAWHRHHEQREPVYRRSVDDIRNDKHYGVTDVLQLNGSCSALTNVSHVTHNGRLTNRQAAVVTCTAICSLHQPHASCASPPLCCLLLHSASWHQLPHAACQCPAHCLHASPARLARVSVLPSLVCNSLHTDSTRIHTHYS